jgi:uncharacterized membrane protein
VTSPADSHDEGSGDQTSLRPAQPGEIDALRRAIVEEVPLDKAQLPPPTALGGYEKVLPGCADRLVTMAEKEQAFLHEITKKRVQTAGDGQKRGQRFALAVVCIMVAAVVACAALDQPGVAKLLGGLTLSSIVLAFLGQKVIRAYENRHDQDNDESE